MLPSDEVQILAIAAAVTLVWSAMWFVVGVLWGERRAQLKKALS